MAQNISSLFAEPSKPDGPKPFEIPARAPTGSGLDVYRFYQGNGPATKRDSGPPTISATVFEPIETEPDITTRIQEQTQAMMEPYTVPGAEGLSANALQAKIKANQQMHEEFFPVARQNFVIDNNNYSLQKLQHLDPNGRRYSTLQAYMQSIPQGNLLQRLKLVSPWPKELDLFYYYASAQNYKKNFQPIRELEAEIQDLQSQQYFQKNLEDFQKLPPESQTAIYNAALAESKAEYVTHFNSYLSFTPEYQKLREEKNTTRKTAEAQAGYTDNLFYFAKMLSNKEVADAFRRSYKENFVDKDPILSSLLSVNQVLKGAPDTLWGTLKTNIHNWTTGEKAPADVNDAYHLNTRTATFTRETVAENIRRDTGVDILGDVYQTAAYLTDALVVAPTAAASPVVPAVILGAETAAFTATNIAERGGSAGQALFGAMVSGVAETAFNLFSFGDLVKAATTPTRGVKATLSTICRGMFVNAADDTVSQVVNFITDELVMGDKSRYNTAVQDYMQAGLSEEQAKQQAGSDMAKQITYTAVFAMLRGGLQTAGANVYARHNAKGSDSADGAFGQRADLGMDGPTPAAGTDMLNGASGAVDPRDLELMRRVNEDWDGSNPLGEKNDISIEDAAAKMAGVDSSDSAVVNSHGQDYTGDAIAPSENIERLIGESVPGRKTHGKSTQFEKQGGMEQAFEDFNSFNPTDVRVSNNTTIGTLSDGRIINVRPDSSEGSITLEIYNPTNSKKLKFRYKE